MTKKIICDVCGKDCFGGCDNEFATVKATWGYDSEKDLIQHNFHLCEGCFDKAVDFLEKSHPKRPFPDPLRGTFYGPPDDSGKPVKD